VTLLKRFAALFSRGMSGATKAATHQDNGGSVATMHRAVGYCLNEDCSEYTKGVFLLNHGDSFNCPRCSMRAWVEPERAKLKNGSQVFREVRIEYNFCPIELKYREVAIVTKDDVEVPEDANVLTVYSPLIKTDKRALRVAETYLGHLEYNDIEDGKLPWARETLIDLDKPRDTVRKELEEMHYRLFYAKQKKLAKSS
jgi:ribosomal protein S27AE